MYFFFAFYMWQMWASDSGKESTFFLRFCVFELEQLGRIEGTIIEKQFREALG